MGVFLTRADVVAGAILPYEDVPVPELGAGAVQRVRCLTALEKDTYEVGFWPPDPARPGAVVYDARGARGRLLALACVQEDGTPTADTATWNSVRADVGDRLFDVAQRIAGMNATVETLKKALRAAQAGASRTT